MQWLVAWVAVVLVLGARGAAEYNLSGEPGQGYIVEVVVGNPGQKLNVLIDTGSSNFAVAAAPHPNINTYFRSENSSTYRDLNIPVTVRYTQGNWSGRLASDYVYFPTLNSVTKVRCDIAFITESKNFYMNGSNWQGILGVAYPTISQPDSTVVTWLDSLQNTNSDRTMAFSLTLCGTRDAYHTDHYGSFEILNNVVNKMEGLLTTPVVRDWYYEVVLTALHVGNTQIDTDCRTLNGARTIVDSGTTNIRLPDSVFDQVVGLIKGGSQGWGPVQDRFWLSGEVACWPEPMQTDALPSITLGLLHSKNEEIALHLPSASYIRQVSTYRSEDAEPEFCYKFGVERSAGGVVLGVAAIEGFEVIFNRTDRTIGFRRSRCGPNVTLSGPFRSRISEDLLQRCTYKSEQPTMLEIAAYMVGGMLVVASVMFVYLLGQWLKDRYLGCHVISTSMSLSHANLINEDP